MAPSSVEEVRELLRSGNEGDLLGIPEEDWLDFKAQPYVLADDKHKWELAKDVTAMASNPAGGCIVLGIATKKRMTDFVEASDELKPFPCGLVDDQQYRDIVASYVYPQVRGLSVNVYVRGAFCLALIAVPAQHDDDRPFVLKRVVDIEGDVVDAFAIPSRDGSHTRWAPIGQVHRDLSDGRWLRKTRLAGPPSQAEPEIHGPSLSTRLSVLVSEFEQYMDWPNAAVYALSAAPNAFPERIPDFFGSLAEAFARPRPNRYAGFGIGWYEEPQIENGSLIAVDADFRIRRLDPDGVFTVGVKAEEDFLGRVGQPTDGDPRPLPINPVVLVEFTYEFCRFQAETLAPRIAGDWRLGLCLRGAKTRPWGLLLAPGRTTFGPEYHEASADDWVKEITATSEPERDAFELLTRVYALFGLSERTIPFASNDRIRPEELVALK